MPSKNQRDARTNRLQSRSKTALTARKGGVALRNLHKDDPDYFRNMGKRGGLKAGRDHAGQSQRGKLGYQATLNKLGHEAALEKIVAWREARGPQVSTEEIVETGRLELRERAQDGLSAYQAHSRMDQSIRQQMQRVLDDGERQLQQKRQTLDLRVEHEEDIPW